MSHTRTLTRACADETAEECEEQTYDNRNDINPKWKFNKVSECVSLSQTFSICWSYSDTISVTLQAVSPTVLTDLWSEHKYDLLRGRIEGWRMWNRTGLAWLDESVSTHSCFVPSAEPGLKLLLNWSESYYCARWCQTTGCFFGKTMMIWSVFFLYFFLFFNLCWWMLFVFCI